MKLHWAKGIDIFSSFSDSLEITDGFKATVYYSDDLKLNKKFVLKNKNFMNKKLWHLFREAYAKIHGILT